MFGALFGIGEERIPILRVFECGFATGASARDRPNGDFIIANTDENFGTGTGQRKAGQVEMIKKR